MKEFYFILAISLLSVILCECAHYTKECNSKNCMENHDSINNLKK